MRYLHPGVRLPPDPDRLGDGVDHGPALSPDMARVEASERGGHGREGYQLLRRRVAAGCVYQPRRQPERALDHCVGQQLLHLLELPVGRLDVVQPDHPGPERVRTHQGADVDRRAQVGQPQEVFVHGRPVKLDAMRLGVLDGSGSRAAYQRGGRPTAVANELGGDSLTDLALCQGQPEQTYLRMSMDVDEPGTYDESLRVDRHRTLRFGFLIDARYPRPVYRDIALLSGGARAVDDRPVLDQYAVQGYSSGDSVERHLMNPSVVI